MRLTLLDCWQDTVRRHGANVALIEAATGQYHTFAQLDARSDAWLRAHRTALAGIAGKSVVFSAPNGARWFDLMLGLIKSQAVAVPMDAAEPAASQRRLAEAIRAGAIWDQDRFVPVATGGRPARRRWGASHCLIKLTSGSTGTPRPLPFTHTQLIADATQVMSTMNITPSDLNYALIPLGHSYGLGNVTLPLLIAGVPTVCGISPLPHAIEADVAKWKPTVFPGVPAILRALAATDGLRLESLRRIISAGAPLPVETADAFLRRFGRHVHSFYGSSETGGISFDRDGRATLAGSVGTPLDGVTLKLLRGNRLQVSSAAVITANNRRRHENHGAWLMGDRVSIDPANLLTLHGRLGTTVKIAGRRVELAEVAAAIRRLAGVDDVWVGASEGTEPVIGAAVATLRTATDLRHALAGEMPGWKVPKRWLVLPALPQTERGKTDTRALSATVFGKRATP